jgi:hypothetical protein
MNVRPRWLLVAAAMLVSGAAVAAAFGTSTSDWRRLHRPLHFPHVLPASLCPSSVASESTVGRALNGEKPVYLMSVGDASAGVIEVSDQYADSKGWLEQKTPWAVERRYTGPMLVRGRRLDEPGPVRFAKAHGQHLSELRFAAGERNALDKRYRWLASAALFRSPGCYGFQVDGTSFSKVVVMRVVEELIAPAGYNEFCGFGPDCPSSHVPALLRRRLRLPTLTPGERCPVSAPGRPALTRRPRSGKVRSTPSASSAWRRLEFCPSIIRLGPTGYLQAARGPARR